MKKTVNKKKYLLAKSIIIMSGLLLTNTIASNNTLEAYMNDRIAATEPLPVIRTTTGSPDTIKKNTLSHYHFNSPVEIKNIKIETNIRALGSSFQQGLIFSDLNIQRNLQISLSEFDQLFQIKKSSTIEPIDIYSCHLNGKTSIIRNKFKDGFSLNQSIINDDLIITYNDFQGPFNFNHNDVKTNSKITNNRFNSSVSIQNSMFNNHVNFNGNELDVKSLDLSHSTFEQGISFRNTLMSGYLNLQGISSPNQEIDLTKIKLLRAGEKIQINLIDVDLDQVKMNYTTFNLAFPKLTPQHTKLHIYAKLLAQFEKNGLTQSYNNLYKEYSQFSYAIEKKKLTHFIDKHWWEYGLKKNIAYQWLGVIFLIFVIMNNIMIDGITKNFKSIGFVSKERIIESQSLNRINRFIYLTPLSVLLTIHLITRGLIGAPFPDELPDNPEKVPGWAGNSPLLSLYLILHPIFGFVAMLFTLEFLLT
jgi:hypothetical protein